MSIVAKKIMMGSGSTVALPSDDQFNRVSFLSHFDGTNNGVNNIFDDGSTSNHTITANGNVTQGSFGPFARPDGEWGISYNDGYVRFPDSADWTLGDTFTLEAFIFPTKLLGYNNIMNHGNWYFTVLANGALQVYGMGGDGDSTSGVVALNTWSHVAFSVSSGTGTFYVNGVARGTTSSNDIGDGSGEFYCGKQGTGYWPFYGVQSNYRVVKGTAVYTSNFTVPTSKLTAITNTKLLMGQSNRFVDNSASGHVAEVGGTIPAVSAFGPFLTSAVYDPAVNGASAFFDGSGDYLSFADSADWDFGTGDFTVEGWVNPASDLASDTQFIGFGDGDNGGNFGFEATGKPYFYHDGYYARTNTALTLVSWSHIAFVRSSGTLSCYINGTSQASSSYTGNVGGSLAPRVGAYSGGQYFKGYMQDVRILKGTAVYTSNFTPPTAPLTAITNTKLLLNMADGQAIDSAAQNNLTLAGNAKISTSVKKFGATSLSLDGGTSYCFARYPQQGGGTGDFTIEFWVYGIFNNDQVKTIFDGRSSGDTSHFMLAQEADNTWLVFDSAGGTVASGWDANTFSNNTWTHVAISRASGTTKYFIDGTQTASVSDTSNWVAGDFTIGGRYAASGNSHNGYIDDFRVSMMARYTSNFTAPSEPFADKGQ